MTGNELDQVTFAMLVSWLIEAGKRSQSSLLRWMTSERPQLLRAVAALGAALTAAGVSWSYSGGELHVFGLTLGNIGLFLWIMIQQVLLQYGGFRLMFSRNSGTQR